jgi:hypothetical protein
MKKKELLNTASQLKQPSQNAVDEYSSKADAMAGTLNERLSKRKDITQLIGEGNLDMMYENHRNHLRFMISLFKDYNPLVLTETVLWVFRAYRSHGFNLTYWPAQLDNWVQILKDELSKDCFDEVYPFYLWMIVNNPAFAILSDETLLEEFRPKHSVQE